MATRTLQTIIQLRRNTEAYFELIKNSYLPLNGEVVLVDTASNGIRVKVGDGVHYYADLDYADLDLRAQATGIVVRGYFYNGTFYTDIEHTITVVPYGYKIYIDIETLYVYTYNPEEAKYECLNYIPEASHEVAGIAKLYNETGNNTDGSMTQSSISTELGRKFEIAADSDEGLIFTSVS